MSRFRLTSLLVLMVGCLVAPTSPARAGSDTDHIDHEHRFVRIGAASIHPEVSRLAVEDAAGWVNYSSKIARVSFDAEVAKKLTCSSPSGFHLTGDRLESRGIQSMQFASLCRFAPGEYAYRVELFSGVGGAGRGYDRVIQGRLVVQ